MKMNFYQSENIVIVKKCAIAEGDIMTEQL